MDIKDKDKSVALKQSEVQCWLEEYRALRNEIDLHLTSVRYMVTLNTTAVGTIAGLSLYFKTIPLLLIIPILSAAIGFIVYVHGRRMGQLGHYIESRIKPKLVEIIGDKKVLGWESYLREIEGKGSKISLWFANAGMGLWAFAIPSILALIFSAKEALTTEPGWCVLWVIGLILTIIAIPVFAGERTFWSKKSNKE